VPSRRCVGCGRIALKPELVRIAATGDGEGGPRRAVQDPTGSMPGRGAYLCRAEDAQAPVADCLSKAIRRGGIARGLRSGVKLDPKLVESVSR
jgi:uncharacterized protein